MAEYKPEFNYYSVNLDIQTPTSTQEKPSYNIPNVVIPSKNIPELPASEQITTGADWSEVEDDDGNKPADNATDDTAADAAQGTANLRITTFIQSAIPTSLAAGDLFIDTDDGKMYRATGIGDTTIEAGKWIRVDLGLYPALIDALQTTNAPAAAGADVTGDNEAATIASQGALATEDIADFDTQVAGIEKPDDNATKNIGALADKDAVDLARRSN